MPDGGNIRVTAINREIAAGSHASLSPGHYVRVSVADSGAVFHVWLPAAANAKVPQQEVNETRPKSQHSAGTILLMDDEDIVLESMKAILESDGYEVITAGNGREALDSHLRARVERKPIAAIILDLTIPGSMGGKEVVREMRKTDKTTPIIVSSGYSEGPVMSAPHAFGFTAALPKPIRIAELTELLNKHLTGE
jgi:two-component system, cell cycle sensor histidine kinase and response regulator CckA